MKTQAANIRLLEDLLATCQVHDYCGHDPFDGLNSALFDLPGMRRSRLLQVAWLQFHKRSPVNLRPLMGVPRRRNPKGVALIILGLIELWRLSGNAVHLDEARALGEWLLDNRVDHDVWKHSAWGYHFDWAARAFHVPRGKPNAITTCYVARALGALGDVLGEARFVDASIDAGLFLDTLYLEVNGHRYYAYIPGEKAFVHNASLWTAALVAKTAVALNQPQRVQRVLEVARQSVSMQLPDGAWRYGTRAHHGFIDAFHTGYNLEALDSIRKTLGVTEFDSAIERGIDYYRRTFIMPDGTVRYYNHTVWPIDTHNMSQALITLLRVGNGSEDRMLAHRVLDRAMKTLYMSKKRRFVYQRGRVFDNRINYLRWTQAWAFYSIAYFLRKQDTEASS